MAPSRPPPGDNGSTVVTNRKALRDYHIDERLEAGLVLTGTEVKSLRQGTASLTDAYADLKPGEALLRGLHIPVYTAGNQFNHEPDRPRKLLLHRREIVRLMSQAARKGYTVVGLRVYFTRRGFAKVELGLGRGKHHQDKREDLKRRDSDRDARREIARAMRR